MSNFGSEVKRGHFPRPEHETYFECKKTTKKREIT